MSEFYNDHHFHTRVHFRFKLFLILVKKNIVVHDLCKKLANIQAFFCFLEKANLQAFEIVLH